MHAPAEARPAIKVSGVSKIYASGFQALKDIDLEIRRGEIFALLGPNGAGKTTLINLICGIVRPGTGTIQVAGYDITRDYREARKIIGLVPQELSTDAFETVWNAVSFSRGLYGKPRNPAYVEHVLRDLSLWDKRASRIKELSGGMKRRLLIAKALSHEPEILFLDEPTSGLDPIGARAFDSLVRALSDSLGLTVFMVTHDLDTLLSIIDRTIALSTGKVIADGPVAAVMRSDHPWIQEYFSARAPHEEGNR
jgi:ABC-2 type transport system ATP-binding protein